MYEIPILPLLKIEVYGNNFLCYLINSLWHNAAKSIWLTVFCIFYTMIYSLSILDNFELDPNLYLVFTWFPHLGSYSYCEIFLLALISESKCFQVPALNWRVLILNTYR